MVRLRLTPIMKEDGGMTNATMKTVLPEPTLEAHKPLSDALVDDGDKTLRELNSEFAEVVDAFFGLCEGDLRSRISISHPSNDLTSCEVIGLDGTAATLTVTFNKLGKADKILVEIGAETIDIACTNFSWAMDCGMPRLFGDILSKKQKGIREKLVSIISDLH